MHICIIIDRLDFGGAERVALNFVDEQLKIGNSITLVTIDDIVKVAIDNRINYRSLNFKKQLFKYYKNKQKMYSLLNDIQKEYGKFDLILVHLYKASRVMKSYNHDCIYHIVHSTQSQSALKDKKGFKRYHAKKKIQRVYNNLNLICVSKGVQVDLLNVMNVKPKTVQTIYNPFDIQQIRNKAKESISTSFTNMNYIIFVGRLVKEKRVDYLLNAYAKSHIDEILVIVGDGEEKENLAELVLSLNIQDKVIFVGSVGNPYPYMQAAKFLILCSLYEGLPTVLIESLILQTPIISTNCPSGPKEITHFYTDEALILDNFDINKLTEKIVQFSLNTPEVSQNCMATFDSHNISNQYIQLAQSCNKIIK